MGFELGVASATAHSLVKVNLKTVKVGAIDAGELGLAANGQTAAAAHAGAIDHDGVHGNNGLHAEGLGGSNDKLHHDQRTDGDDFIVVLAVLDQFLQRSSNNALLAMGAIVGHQEHLVGHSTELVLQDHQILVAEANDGVDLAAHFMQLLGDGESNGAAHAAAHNCHLLQAGGMRGDAQGANKVMNVVTLIQVVQLDGGTANDLEDDGDGALLAIVIGDGQGDPLAVSNIILSLLSKIGITT